MKYTIALSIILLTLVFAISCKEDAENPVMKEDTWSIIQEKILDTKCVSCHVDGSTFAKQSGLILTSDVSYNNLIDKTPTNNAAAADDLKLLETSGLESLYNSFLWEKINAPNQEHYYAEHPEYGEIMPPGDAPLTNGEIEYIRQWIVAGAPQKGSVAEESLLDNTTTYVKDTSFTVLPKPSSGLQLHIGPFGVTKNYEREFYTYRELENTEDLYVNRIHTAMRPGTHHLILYDFKDQASLPTKDILRDIRDENGNYINSTLTSLADQRFLFGTQLRKTDYKYPDGVALKIASNSGLDLNTHYTNYGTKDILGELYVNLHTIDKSEVQYEAQNLFLSKTDFSLPPNEESIVHTEYTFNDSRNIFMLTAHAHKYMKEFKIYIKGGARDGELIYYTNDWEHPEIKEYDPPIELQPGEGLRGETLYDNTTDKTLRFGLLSLDEMNIIFGAYYKK